MDNYYIEALKRLFENKECDKIILTNNTKEVIIWKDLSKNF